MSTHFSWDDSDLLLQLRINPRASRDRVMGLMGDRLKVSITAPPVDGQANDHLVAWIAKQFGVSKSAIDVVSGQTARNKTLRIRTPRIIPEPFNVTNHDRS